MRPALLITLVLMLAPLSWACSDDEAALQVEVGVVQSLSGPASIYGASALRGVELAAAQINRSDGGVRVSLRLIDDNSDVQAGTAAFETLTGQGVTAIIGPTLSNVAFGALPVSQQAGVPALGATLTAAGITEVGDHVFRVALTERVVVPAALERVHAQSPIANAALILDSADAFSRSSADAMRAGIEAIGATVAVEVDIATGDLAAALQSLQPNPPDAFLVTPLVEQSAEIVKAIRAAGFQQTIVGGNSFNTLGIAAATGRAIEGAYAGAAWNPALETPASARFTQAYTAEYGSAPDLFAAQGYSALYLLVDAVRRAGTTDRAAVRDTLASTRGLEAPLGVVTISDQREAVHDPVVQRFEGGRLVVLR